MKKILSVILALVLFMPFTVNAAALSISSPNTGDTAIIISVVLVVIAIALFIFIRRRKN